MIASSARGIAERQCRRMTLPDPPRADERDSHPLGHALVSWLSAISVDRLHVDDRILSLSQMSMKADSR